LFLIHKDQTPKVRLSTVGNGNQATVLEMLITTRVRVTHSTNIRVTRRILGIAITDTLRTATITNSILTTKTNTKAVVDGTLQAITDKHTTLEEDLVVPTSEEDLGVTTPEEDLGVTTVATIIQGTIIMLTQVPVGTMDLDLEDILNPMESHLCLNLFVRDMLNEA
jgi:hypothetical protein